MSPRLNLHRKFNLPSFLSHEALVFAFAKHRKLSQDKPLAGRLFVSLALGGDERVRTDDPLLAKQVLSQLSYTPIFMKVRSSLKTFWAFKIKQRGTHTFQYAGLCLTLDVRSILRLTSSP